MKRLAVVAVLAVHSAAFAEFAGVTNYWVGSNWGLYDTAANWRVNDRDAGANAVPTAADMISATNATHKINLNGGTHTIAQIASIADKIQGIWNENYYLEFTNGTLNITTLLARRVHMKLWKGATVVFKPGLSLNFLVGVGGNVVNYDIMNGGRIDINNLKYYGFVLTVNAGGVANICDGEIITHPTCSGNNRSEYHLYGELNAPLGINFRDDWASSASTVACYSSYRLYPGGKLTLGGPMKKNTRTIPMTFQISGGTLKSTGAVTFEKLTSITVDPNAAVTFDVDEGASLHMTNATFGAGSVVTKTGAGNFILGHNPVASLVQNGGTVTLPVDGVLPDAMTMNAGTLSIERRGTTLPVVAFAEGCTLNLNEIDTRIDSPANYSGLNVTVGEGALVRGATVLCSTDADFLAYVKGQLDSALPAGWSAQIDGGCIKLLSVTANTFDATKSSDLADTAAWAGGSVPTGEDVVISGAGTVNFNASSPVFSKITVEGDATLSVSGGTLEDPVTLPPMELRYDSRLLVNGEAFAQSTNGLDCIANAISLPVLEIATNSTFILQTPNLPKTEYPPMLSNYDDYGFRIKNVNLKWYGELRMPVARTNENLVSQARIGWAENLETSYLALDCQGGSLYRLDTLGGYINANSPLTIASPKPGGTVIPVGTLLLRDYHRDNGTTTAQVGNSTIIGFNNPESVRIPIVFDGDTDVKCASYNKLAGGADLTIKGPAKWSYEHEFYNDQGWTRDLKITESATLTLEGGGLVSITPSYSTWSHNIYGFHNLGTDENVVSLVARDSYIGFWEWRSSGNTSARIENSYIMVGQLFRYGAPTSGTNSLVTQTSLFNNFKHVEVPEGKTMWVLATNIWNGSDWPGFERLHDWDRVTTFGPPITGGGNVAVSNALLETRTYGYNYNKYQSEYSMTAIITNGANTATGLAYADVPSPVGARSYLLFGDGANWAGTVVANGWLGLTNLTAESAAPVSVTFGSMLFTSNFPVRLWKDGDVLTNDVINITSGISGEHGFEVERMDGYTPQNGDTFTLGAYPAEAALPNLSGSGKWRLERAEVDGASVLKLKYKLRGCVFTIK